MSFQSMMSTTNPFIGPSNTTSVNTPVIWWRMSECSSSRRRRRRSATPVGLRQGTTTLVDINIPPTTLGLWVNATPATVNDGIVMIEYNLTSPGSVPVVVRVTPSQPISVKVYVRRHTAPTTTEYDWLLESTANYTMYLTADLTKDVTHLYVGVRSRAGMSSVNYSKVYYSTQ